MYNPDSDSKTEAKTWLAPISFGAEDVASLLRESLLSLDFDFSREKTEKHYTKMAIIMPMPQFAYVYRFNIVKPSQFTIDTYDTRPHHSGLIPYIEVHHITDDNISDVQSVLQTLSNKCPRKPWKFTWPQRLINGILTPEIVTARKKWAYLGIK